MLSKHMPNARRGTYRLNDYVIYYTVLPFPIIPPGLLSDHEPEKVHPKYLFPSSSSFSFSSTVVCLAILWFCGCRLFLHFVSSIESRPLFSCLRFIPMNPFCSLYVPFVIPPMHQITLDCPSPCNHCNHRSTSSWSPSTASRW